MGTRIFYSLLVSLMLVMLSTFLLRVLGNAEGDVLIQLKLNLADPNNVMHSWNATDVNPCRWYHVTCNGNDTVVRVDLGNANLSGQLIPQLGQLQNLQYLELYANSLSGSIPEELGNLTNLVSLELHLNRLSGPIPDTLGKLAKLRFLRLNNNTLTGTIPMSLTTIVTLQVLDLSNNLLRGDVPINGSFSLFAPTSFSNNVLNPVPVSQTPPMSSSDVGNSDSGAIARGVAADAALLFVTLAIVIP